MSGIFRRRSRIFQKKVRATRGVWTALIDIIPGELLCNSVNMREELHNKAASDVSDFPCYFLRDLYTC